MLRALFGLVSFPDAKTAEDLPQQIVGCEFARDFTVGQNLAPRVNAVLFSPAFRKDASSHSATSNFLLDPRQLTEWMLEDNVPARLGLQIHKFVWDPATKGV